MRLKTFRSFPNKCLTVAMITLSGGYLVADGETCPVSTPYGTSVPCDTVSTDYSEASIQRIRVKYEDYCDDKEELAPPSRKTNCHGFAWHGIETGEMVGINNPSYFWEDGSYFPVSGPLPGDKVSYQNVNHSAVVSSIPEKVISKWNQDGPLMLHELHCDEWDASSVVYYRKASWWCSTDIDVNEKVFPTRYQGAQIYSDGTLKSGHAAAFQATEGIVLSAGFYAESGSQLHGYVSACD